MLLLIEPALGAPAGYTTVFMEMVRVKLPRLMVTSSAVPRIPSGPGSTMHSAPPSGQVTPAAVVHETSSPVLTRPSGPAHFRGWGPSRKIPPLETLATAEN